MALSAVNGLAYLHEMSIVHFDLKPDNLLLDGKLQPGYDGSVPSLKVADFGLSKQKWGREFVSGVRDLRYNSLPLLPACLLLPLLLFGVHAISLADVDNVHRCNTWSYILPVLVMLFLPLCFFVYGLQILGSVCLQSWWQ